MSYETTKTEREIRDIAEKARMLKGKFHGMTYEEGVAYALEWILGELDGEETPLD